MPRLSLLLKVHPESRLAVISWLDEQEGRVAILTAFGHDIAALRLPYPVFADVDLVPLGSGIEERIHRDVEMHRRTLAHRLQDYRYQGISLAPDLPITIGQPYESISRLACAAERLFAAGYDTVVIMLEDYSYFHLALFHAARACGITREGDLPLLLEDAEAGPRPYSPVNYDINSFIHQVRDRDSLTPEKRIRFMQSVQMAPGGILVMLATSEQLYADCVAEVIRELRRRQVPHRAIAYNAGIQQSYHQQYGIESTLLFPPGEEYQYPRDRDALLESVKNFLIALQDDVNERTTGIVAGGTTALPLVIRDFADARGFLEDHFNILIQYVISVERLNDLISTLRPASIYCPPAAARLESAVVQIAQIYNIPTVNSVFNAVSTEYRSIVRSSYLTDFITVLGEDQIPVFEASGFDRSRLIPVGQPDLDPVRAMWTVDRSTDYLRKLFPNFHSARKTVLIAMNSQEHDTDIHWLEAICEHAKARRDLQILYKVHPTRDPAPLREFAARRSDLPLILGLEPDKRIHPYLGAASLVITNASHAGTLAAYHRLPLIVVNFTGIPFQHSRYDEEGIALLATDNATLIRAIDELLGNSPRLDRILQAQLSFLRRKLTSNDGHAAGRLVNLLLDPHRSVTTLAQRLEASKH